MKQDTLHYAASMRRREMKVMMIRSGVIADFGYDGGVVGFEILQASKVVEKAGEWSEWDERQSEQSKRRGQERLSAGVRSFKSVRSR